MDTKDFSTAVKAGEPSRLPAGSTLLVNGIHVPHPHAEVNLPGLGDPRLGDTKAVTEVSTITVDGDDVHAEVKQEPLHDEVKPRRLTVADDAELKPLPASTSGVAASPSPDLKVKEDPLNKVVELPKE